MTVPEAQGFVPGPRTSEQPWRPQIRARLTALAPRMAQGLLRCPASLLLLPLGAGVSTTLFTFPLKYPPRNQFFHKVPPSQEEASPGSHCGPRTVPALGAPGGLPSLSL